MAKSPAATPATNLPLDASGQRLLTTVLQNLDDFEARLVFADYLSERGDPRGEFIELQCALNRPLVGAHTSKRRAFDGDVNDLQKREQALLKRYEKAWLSPFRPFIRTWRWARGFVDQVVADSTKFLDGVPAIFATTPLVEVQLTALKKGMLHTLAAQSTTARLTSFDVSHQKLDAAALAALDADTWRGVRTLRLAGNRFGVDGAQALAKARGLSGLTRLILNDAQLTDGCVEALVQAPFFSKLTDLELGWNAGISGSACVLAARAGTSLKTLRLRSTGLEAADFPALAAAAPTLEYLRVSAGFEQLARPYFASSVTVSE